MLAERQHDEAAMRHVGIAFLHGGGERLFQRGVGKVGQSAGDPVQIPGPRQVGGRDSQGDGVTPPPQ